MLKRQSSGRLTRKNVETPFIRPVDPQKCWNTNRPVGWLEQMVEIKFLQASNNSWLVNVPSLSYRTGTK
jgi:hypothetical protein